MVYMYHSFLIHSSADGHLGCFHVLAVINSAANSMYIIKGETDHQPRLDAWDKCLGLVHWEDPEESDGEGGGRGDWDGEYM